MIDADVLVETVFSGLTALTINEIEDAGEVIVVHARTRGGAVKCPSCGTLTGHVHAFGERMPADVPVDGRRVLVRVRVRRMRCRAEDCARQTFREQVPGVLERYQRRTVWLSVGVMRRVAVPRWRHPFIVLWCQRRAACGTREPPCLPDTRRRPTSS